MKIGGGLAGAETVEFWGTIGRMEINFGEPGCSEINMGPGVIPCTIKALIKSAMELVNGMPKLRRGTMPAYIAALLAASAGLKRERAVQRLSPPPFL